MRLVGLVVMSCACGGGGGGGGGGGKVSVVAHVVHGASNGTSRVLLAPAAPSNGFWVVTPTSVKATVVSINFNVDGSGGGPGSIGMPTNCALTYDQAAASQ